MKDGVYAEAVKVRVLPFAYRGFMLENEYFGRVVTIENRRRIHTECSPIRRLSRGDALKDARRLIADRYLSLS